MIKGFLAGTLALSVVYVLLQSGSARRLEQGGNALVHGMRKLFDPTVAGIGDHTKERKSTNTISPATIYGYGGGAGVPKAM